MNRRTGCSTAWVTLMNTKFFCENLFKNSNPSDRAAYGVGLRPFACRNCGS